MRDVGASGVQTGLHHGSRPGLGFAVLALTAVIGFSVPLPSRAENEQAEQAVRLPTNFDPVAATEAYLATVPPEERARVHAYVEGGYWMKLWGFLYVLGIAWLLLGTRLSAGMRARAERVTRFYPLQVGLYAVQYIVLTTLLSFPLTVYSGFLREHQYGLATQAFGPWLTERLTSLGVAVVLGSVAIIGLYEVLRRAPRSWWLWGAGLATLFVMFMLLIAPVFISPLFNTYTPLKDETVRGPILEMARAHGVPAGAVLVSDASRQTSRIGANVSGFLGTERITLNDNLLNRCSLAEIEWVMGHELGHYVLNHRWEMLVYSGVLYLLGFGFLRGSFDRVHRRWGRAWGVRGISDVAGLPLLSALFSIYLFAITPISNTISRSNEAEADQFGISASRQPDGFAQVALKLGEYRKVDPGPIEEWIFFDHPSGRNRILAAMRWKAATLERAEPSGS